MARERKVYSPEFKHQAVEMVRAPGGTLSGTARTLGVSEGALRRWVEVHVSSHPSLATGPEEIALEPQVRIRQLERENAILRQEREILKAATAFFARESR